MRNPLLTLIAALLVAALLAGCNKDQTPAPAGVVDEGTTDSGSSEGPPPSELALASGVPDREFFFGYPIVRLIPNDEELRQPVARPVAPSDESPMSVALFNDDRQAFEALLEEGELLAQEGEDESLLHAAISAGAIHCVDALVERGVTMPNTYLMIGLYMASESRSLYQIPALLHAGARPDVLISEVISEETTDGGCSLARDFIHAQDYTVLHSAAGKGDVEILRLIVETCPDEICVDVQAEGGTTPLWWAANAGHMEAVEYLLGLGANINATAYGCTSLHNALLGGRWDMVQFLIAHGAEMDLLSAAAIVDGETFQQYVDECTYMELTTTVAPRGVGYIEEYPLMFWAALNSDPACIRILAARGLDVNQSIGLHEYTAAVPLLWAMGNRNYETFRALLELGADPNGRGIARGVPLWLARQFEDRYPIYAELLLEYGADPTLAEEFIEDRTRE
jgi:ankyrin repeat protein